jgi:RNA-directed DNA polymerase
MFGPVIGGWVNYYCRFHPSAFSRVAQHIDRALARWAMRKFRTLHGHPRRARAWVARLSRQRPSLFAHWRVGLAAAAR